MPYYGIYVPNIAKAVSVSTANGSNSPSSSQTVTGNGIAVAASTTNAVNICDEETSDDSLLVVRNKTEALCLLKQHKDARFREFLNEDDAARYARTGCEVVQSKYADVKTPTANLEKSAFRAPTKQELTQFRKKIESGDYEWVKAKIWKNPRYLVSSGDTPVTLKEGYRYNAMHICAIAKKPQIAVLILETVSDPKFADLLTGKKNSDKVARELCNNLLDYYLNMPEKGRNETPLHFAAKKGCLEMVEVLTSYPECKMTANSDGALPKNIICSRTTSTPELVDKIESLLEKRFYVPVLRSMDSAIPPQVGEPFSMSDPPKLDGDPLSPEVKIHALAGPMSQEKAKKFCRRWKTPPRLGSSCSLPIINNPYISPRKGRNSNGTPIRNVYTMLTNSPMSTLQRRSLFNSSQQSAAGKTMADLSITNHIDKQNGNDRHEQDLHGASKMHAAGSKALETNNNEASSGIFQSACEESDTKVVFKSTLCPSTPLLKLKMDLFFTYCDRVHNDSMSTDFDDLNKSHSVQTDYDPSDTPGYKERHIKNTDMEKGLEIIGRELAKQENVEWREYWDFLSDFTNIATPAGLQKLESFFEQRIQEAQRSKKCSKPSNSTDVIELCKNLEICFLKDLPDGPMSGRNGFHDRNPIDSNLNSTSDNAMTTQANTTPYTCVEKSLQVFAKRMTKTIIQNMDNIVSINDTFISELKRLKSLICSFKEDQRFVDVNFTKVHSRFADLISIGLTHSTDITPAVNLKIQTVIQNLIYTPGERREHLDCVCERLLGKLKQNANLILPETLKTEEMCTNVWQCENDCQCQWDTNISRKTSRRQRMESRYKNHQIKQHEQSIQREQVAAKEASDTEGCRDRDCPDAAADESDEDVFWSDFDVSDTDEEAWYTPPYSPSCLSLLDDEADPYDIFIYGNEPTKRDLDVLNAIFHIDISPTEYPNICAWKTALMRYSNEEMDFFPSPAIIKKSHSFSTTTTSAVYTPKTPQLNLKSTHTSTPNVLLSKNQGPSIVSAATEAPIAKRLFVSPMSKSNPTAPLFRTPLNKVRGLFSVYRDKKGSPSGSDGTD